MIRILAVLLSLIFISNAYAAEKKSKPAGQSNASLVQSSAPNPDDLSKKAQEDARKKAII